MVREVGVRVVLSMEDQDKTENKETERIGRSLRAGQTPCGTIHPQAVPTSLLWAIAASGLDQASMGLEGLESGDLMHNSLKSLKADVSAIGR